MGSVKEDGSYFCQSFARRDQADDSQWSKQTHKVFALEVWNEPAIAAMRNASQIKPVDGAPADIFVCNIPGADGDRIALYGLASYLVSDGGEKAKAAFMDLAKRAVDFLKP